jgi:hypothetical protein
MTKDELWLVFVKKNPALLSANVTFSAAGVRKFFDRTFEIALEDGEHDTIEGEAKRTPHPSDSMPDFLKQFLRRKP